MQERRSIKYEIKTQVDLNLSYMPFIKDGGVFVPTSESSFSLGECINLDIQLPGHAENLQVEGKVIWITPKNGLYQIYPGIGIQLVGANAKTLHELIKANLDNTIDIGGYTYGM